MKTDHSAMSLRVATAIVPAALCGLVTCLIPARSAVAQGPEDLLNFAVTPPQQAVGGTIAVVCPELPQPDPENPRPSDALKIDCDALVGNAIGQNPQTANGLAQVTPDQSGVPVDASLTAVGTQARNVGARLAALRGGATRATISRGLAFKYDGKLMSAEEFAKLYRADIGATGGAASADPAVEFGRLGVFINGTVDFGDKDRTDLEAGFDFDTQGVTVGVDYRLTDSVALGAAFGYMNTDVDLDAAGGSLDTDGYSFTLYGTYYPTDRFYVDGFASYGWNDFDQQRNIRYVLNEPSQPQADVNQTMSADFDGDQWDIAIGTGYELSNGPWTYGPVSRLEYVKADVDGFREQASNPAAEGSGWTIAVDDQTFESLTFSVGLRVSYAISQSWGVLVPQARVDWVHEFEGDGEFVTGRFLGDPSQTAFRFVTDAADRNYYPLGVGVSAQFGQGRSAYAYYQTLLGYRNLTDNTFNFGVRLEF